MWSAVEAGIGIISASAVTLKPLFTTADSKKNLGYLDLEMEHKSPPNPMPIISVNEKIVDDIAEPKSIYLEPKPCFEASKQTRRGNIFMLTRSDARDPGLPLQVFDSVSEYDNDAWMTQWRRSSTISR